MKKKEYSIEIGNKKLIAEFNDLAMQANGSVLVRYGNTTVLATVVMSKETKDGDFFPLTVDYEERFYASGKILGSKFVRREGKPTEEAILLGRVVDRTIRPLFDSHIRNEVQVIITVLSIDEDDPDIMSVIAASLALGTSDIPWNGPVSAVRMLKNSELHINPDYNKRDNRDIKLDLVACGKDGLINMIEVAGNEATEDEMNDALIEASKEIEKIQEWQKKIISEIGKEKVKIEKPVENNEISALFKQKISPIIEKYIFNERSKEKMSEINEIWINIFKEKYPEENPAQAQAFFDEIVNDLVHKEAIENGRRPDGRGFDDIRPLYAQAGGISPILHGSGIFYRGETHVFSALTLGGPGDAQTIDGIEVSEDKRFIHHYNFPPFSTGEVGKVGGTNRRMIGHGALAEKALLPIIPPKESFPYTIRIVSEAFSSNGSTSMGSVCGSCLALMDGGVPIKATVAGIASGLMMREKGGQYEYKILTDIQGPEDHYGDMDFKVAGTKNGITAVQMDIKVNGIPLFILKEAFEKAKIARFKIIDLIEKEIPKPRPDISPKAPKIISLKIKEDQIGLVIGSGGKTINKIKERTGVEEITIEDDGSVFITGKNGSAEKARDIIIYLTKDALPKR